MDVYQYFRLTQIYFLFFQEKASHVQKTLYN